MRILAPLATLSLLAACATPDSNYPSLLPRPIENRSDAEPVRADPVVAPDPTLDTRIAEQRALADAAARRFNVGAAEAEARVAVARGVPVGAEAWVRAQAALAELAPIRGETATIVAALEEIAIARASAGDPAYPSLDLAIAEIGSISQTQGDRLAALEDALGS